MPDESSPQRPPGSGIYRDEAYDSLYANNIQFEPSLWDLKLIFGQLDQSDGTKVAQHTAITIPWMQAKLLAYFLEVNLAVHETDYGYIRLPPTVIPQAFDPSTVTEALKPAWEYMAFMHRRFFPELYGQSRPTQPPPPLEG